jgi:hypothetical protein
MLNSISQKEPKRNLLTLIYNIMTKKEFRKIIKDWLNDNSIEFDQSLNTKNLYIFAQKQGFVFETSLEETEETENTEDNETENIEETGTENLEETGTGNLEETNIEETPVESLQRPQPKRPIKQPKKETPNPVLNHLETLPEEEPNEETPENEPTKKDNTWVWALVALIITAAIFMFIKNRKNNGE